MIPAASSPVMFPVALERNVPRVWCPGEDVWGVCSWSEQQMKMKKLTPPEVMVCSDTQRSRWRLVTDPRKQTAWPHPLLFRFGGRASRINKAADVRPRSLHFVAFTYGRVPCVTNVPFLQQFDKCQAGGSQIPELQSGAEERRGLAHINRGCQRT